MTGAVELQWFEFLTAVHCGTLRFAFGEARNLNHAATEQRDWVHRLVDEIVGTCGEIAWAKWRNRYWNASVNTFHHEPDVGTVEVRATLRDNGCLILRNNDEPSRWYVLVTGTPPTMTVRGWIKGEVGRQTQYVDNPRGLRPAWFIPQTALTFREQTR